MNVYLFYAESLIAADKKYRHLINFILTKKIIYAIIYLYDFFVYNEILLAGGIFFYAGGSCDETK
ncbi:hypothetical protein CHH92_02310 [Bacillus sonorensis]|uniref:Uncharacterized protein n=1 Tax=Bacillus sonorensis L12 TaxID=1274524 RepID=M5PDH2_9BACI|nr:hypothetical protein BSONL12_13056 [Bacillus sonorensis L12]MBG9916749.1 hypothetical protein [Bacillus sonorensis]PAD61299.1 hypothetical protein CHH92_02310 [Bacillus sonorensis]RHJ13530.1 hypothetical protein DW143_02720 [Bacillus sonorensis]TWK72939.1 hypothetical protein CHCC20335_1604 [Bacillus paralicheniformis]